MRPYIGISCFTSIFQIIRAHQSLPPGTNHQLMVGFSISDKAMVNFSGLKQKWQNRMVEKEQLSHLMLDLPNTIRLIHYSSDDSNFLLHNLLKLHYHAGKNLSGFQLNVVWPDIKSIKHYRTLYTKDESILVFNAFPRNMDHQDVQNDPQKFREKLLPYIPYLDAVLIDSSGGNGTSIDPQKALNYIKAIIDLPVNLVVAGGLTPTNLDNLDPLIEYVGKENISIDIETGVRTPINTMDNHAVTLYIQNSVQKLG